jgi:thioredoxin reductase (NADPH)
VSYCATCDGAFYKDKTVAVVGGGDTALGDALYLSKIAAKVYLIHRREEFRAAKTLQMQAEETPNIEFVMNAVPTEVVGEKHVEALRLLQSGTQRELTVNGVFTAIGAVPNTAMLDGVCMLDKSGYIVAGEEGTTSVPGIFAAGDVRTKSLRQVVTAASDGANCVQSAEEYLRKSRKEMSGR